MCGPSGRLVCSQLLHYCNSITHTLDPTPTGNAKHARLAKARVLVAAASWWLTYGRLTYGRVPEPRISALHPTDLSACNRNCDSLPRVKRTDVMGFRAGGKPRAKPAGRSSAKLVALLRASQGPTDQGPDLGDALGPTGTTHPHSCYRMSLHLRAGLIAHRRDF